MKGIERVAEVLIRERVAIADMQFRFRPGHGTTDAQKCKKNHHAQNKKLYFGFVDLEKAFDHVPREVIWWATRNVGLEKWIV